MTRYYEYKIISGDRIDIISQKFYGKVDNVEPIFKANLWMKIETDLDEYAGKTILIPIEEERNVEPELKHGLRSM